MINASMLKNALKNALANLEANKEYVNSLNVFPVPDGDTGTNMYLTLKSAYQNISEVNSSSCSEISKLVSKGALMGARGNSGVILSQILRGFSKGIGDAVDIDIRTLLNAFVEAHNVSYKAVMKPTEGTILTVIRFISEHLQKNQKKYSSWESVFDEALEIGQIALDKTPELLPVLKEAGVVDAGGQGLLFIIKGMYDGLLGKEANYTQSFEVDNDKLVQDNPYHVIFNINNNSIDVESLKEMLDFCSIINSIDKFNTSVRVDLNTNDLSKVFKVAHKYGDLTNFEIKNQLIDDVDNEISEHKKYGFITVCAGEGLHELFKDLQVDQVVTGGQTMNPSVEDFLKCIKKINADNIFILPNNSNIIMTAENAAEISDKNIIVIPTKTIPQGINVMINYDPENDVDSLIEIFNESINTVKSISITKAVRNTNIDGIDIKEADYMAILDKKIITSNEDRISTLNKAIELAIDDNTSIITIIKGEDVSGLDFENEVKSLEDKFVDIEFEKVIGNQPVYDYLISIE